MKKEVEWKQIKNYNYEVSDDGQVRNKESKKILTQRNNTQGYKIVDIQVEKKNRTIAVHRLVAETFLGERHKQDSNLQVDHIDRDKVNNNLKNLRWVTRSENIKNRNKILSVNINLVKKIIELHELGKSAQDICLLV
jgi:hypothetical protein